MQPGAWSRLLCVVCAVLSSGCSVLFVQSPPSDARDLPLSEEVECSTSKVAPVIDVALATTQVVGTAYALSRSDYSAPISKEADVALGIGLTAAYAASAIHGFSATGECIDARAERRARRRRAPNGAPATRVAPAPSTPAAVTPATSTPDPCTPAPGALPPSTAAPSNTPVPEPMPNRLMAPVNPYE